MEKGLSVNIRIVFSHPAYNTREFQYKISCRNNMKAVYYEIVKYLTLLWNFDGELKPLLISSAKYVQNIDISGNYKKTLKYNLQDYINANGAFEVRNTRQFLFMASIRENN